MCFNSRVIYNKYADKHILVKCGKCPACIQEAANARANKIRNHGQGGLCLFVTLTYANKFIPYCKSDDLVNIDPSDCRSIPVYRDSDVRWYRSKKYVVEGITQISSLDSTDCAPYCYSVPHLNKKSGCTGVILWSDVQNFIKRLRINLERSFSYHGKISYYAVGEYGKHTYRPHFHLLIYFEQGSKETYMPFIIKSWSYGDLTRSSKRVQESINTASYVASYVNKSPSLPDCCKARAIKQKHSHSRYFGMGLDCFSLTKILFNLHKGVVTYNKEILKDGKPMLVTLPLPQYVVNRFFPKFKGLSSFTTDEILQLLRSPIYLWNRLGRCRLRQIEIDCGNRLFRVPCNDTDLMPSEFYYSPDDFLKWSRHLNKCVDYYIKETGKTRYDYAIDFCMIWRMRTHWINKMLYDGVRDFNSFYENIVEFLNNPDIAPTLNPYLHYELVPDHRLSEVQRNSHLNELYVLKENIKDFNSLALSSIDDEF